ncbi:hypothetical protein FACS1894184_03370 [Clostridia bacterium]|nr:hypothetical protein FACS1894184_03370 [Clostridia bacterium]
MLLKYTNAGGVSLELRQSPPYFLKKLDGVGDIHQSVNTFKASDQDGSFYINSTLDMRNITLEGAIVAATPDEAYELRKRLLKVFTPKQQGTVTYRDRRIGCVVEDIKIVISSKERAPGFFISLLCPSPFFETLDSVRKELAAWQSLFKFILEIPASGIEFGSRQPSQIITLENIGDVACGCEIVFRALGVVTNPELMNLETSEYVRILKTMAAGEEIHVFTHFAGKRVVNVTGHTSVNAFHYFDTGSTFLQLNVGNNLLRYDAATNLDLLECIVFLNPLFLGI